MSASQGKRPQCVEPLAQRPIGKIVVAAAAGSSSNCSYAQALTKAVATRGLQCGALMSAQLLLYLLKQMTDAPADFFNLSTVRWRGWVFACASPEFSLEIIVHPARHRGTLRIHPFLAVWSSAPQLLLAGILAYGEARRPSPQDRGQRQAVSATVLAPSCNKQPL